MTFDNIFAIYNVATIISRESKIGTLLDLGCGHGIVGYHLIPFKLKKTVGVDADLNALNFCQYHRIYDKVLWYDLNNLPLPFRDREYDLVTATELLEHLGKEKSKHLLDEMERVGKWVVISTPTTFFSNQCVVESTGNPHQFHRCCWRIGEFKDRGYRVRGCGNVSFFGHNLKYVSYVLRGFSNAVPELSTQIVAWKKCG